MPQPPSDLDFSTVHAASEPADDAGYAVLRLPTRTYVTKSFAMAFGADVGQPARYIHRVFDHAPDGDDGPEDELEWTEHAVHESPGGRVQITVQVAREAGAVRKIRLARLSETKAGPTLTRLAEFNREESSRLVSLFKALDDIPIEGDTTTLVDGELVRDLAADPSAFAELYAQDPERFRQLIESDVSAAGLVAVAYRRQEVEEFRRLLSDDAHFSEAQESIGSGPEKVWQAFLERNPWMLGVGLSGQLLTSWDDEKLEQTVAGHSVAGPGKRADAFMRTNGRLQMLAFAEIKHHETELLFHREHRPGCWRPSAELAGGVVQAPQTVEYASASIGGRLQRLDQSGGETGEVGYLMRPRSYLVVGHLNQLTGESGGVHAEKHRSFEIFRRNLHTPEVITFDELLARAEWSVELAEGGNGDEVVTAAAAPPARPRRER